MYHSTDPSGAIRTVFDMDGLDADRSITRPKYSGVLPSLYTHAGARGVPGGLHLRGRDVRCKGTRTCTRMQMRAHLT